MKRLFFPSGVKLALAVVVLAGGLAAGSQAFAQQFLKNYAPPMPKIEMLPEADFDAKTTVHEDTPAGDKALSYKFRLPPDWKKPEDAAVNSYQVSNKILGELLRFYGPPVLDSRSYFSIQAINLEYKLTAQQWLLQYLLANGFTIQGIREDNEMRAEALYVKVEDSVTYVIRAVAQMNGKRVVLAQYFMPADNWEEEKQMQAQVIESFELTNPVKEPVETMTKYHFLDIAEFQYPVSWEFKPAPLKSADRMSFELLNVQSEEKTNWKKTKTLNGRVQVDIVSYDTADSVDAEMEKLKVGLGKIGLVVGDKIETLDKLKFADSVDPAPAEVFSAVDSESNLLKYEYWVTVIEQGEYYYFVSLITPSRDEDYFVWARNTETYKLILELFQPLEEGGLVYR